MHGKTVILAVTALVSASVTSAVPLSSQQLKRALTSDAGSINGKSFDYVIAGGGLGGSVLGARLAEDSTKTVLIIEAGQDQESNPVIYDAGAYQQAFGDSNLNWKYQTVPQANGRREQINAGKMLGGSTGINGLAWSKPHTFQIDSMEQIGNPGLNWDSLQAYVSSLLWSFFNGNLGSYSYRNTLLTPFWIYISFTLLSSALLPDRLTDAQG